MGCVVAHDSCEKDWTGPFGHVGWCATEGLEREPVFRPFKPISARAFRGSAKYGWVCVASSLEYPSHIIKPV